MSGPTREFGPGPRLLGFLAALVVVFGAGVGLGALAGPTSGSPTPSHAPHPSGHP